MKIGIVTHYYNSTNYGGSLQAYALCQVLRRMGHDAYQLQIDYSEGCYDLTDHSATATVKKWIGKPVKRFLKQAALYLKPQARRLEVSRRENQKALLSAFSSFNQGKTPHSSQVYTEKTIQEAVQEYDAFITGSDQVWNPNWYFPPFFLSFVPNGVRKISYAASISHPTLQDYVKAVYREQLRSFTGISVREEDAIALLEDVAPENVECVLDPTLLLTEDEWSQVTAPVQVEGKYAFCYFLGDDPAVRQIATQYAKEQGLTLVTIPHAAGIRHQSDLNFADMQVENPSVEDFLSLIRHASYVFTDSFHASVFSLIFRRQFVVFARNSHKHMGSRLYHLSNLFDIPERFCDTREKASCEYINELPPIDYLKDFPKFLSAKERSFAFLQKNLK